nr:hypothetical protein Q903MT_gene1145 [Picea sitchensis]
MKSGYEKVIHIRMNALLHRQIGNQAIEFGFLSKPVYKQSLLTGRQGILMRLLCSRKRVLH